MYIFVLRICVFCCKTFNDLWGIGGPGIGADEHEEILGQPLLILFGDMIRSQYCYPAYVLSYDLCLKVFFKDVEWCVITLTGDTTPNHLSFGKRFSFITRGTSQEW